VRIDGQRYNGIINYRDKSKMEDQGYIGKISQDMD
jgi:hypothetical protein